MDITKLFDPNMDIIQLFDRNIVDIMQLFDPNTQGINSNIFISCVLDQKLKYIHVTI